MTAGGDITLAPGARVGRYRVIRCIGSGGMAAVYEAEHDDLEKRVALKALHPVFAQDPEARARFLREGRAASRIRHPNVVEVFDVGQEDGTLFLVMEHLPGEDLATVLSREGSLGVERLVDLVLPVIAAVATAHEAGVIHRDLKPENIFLARARNGALQPKVLDFGISKVTGLGTGPRLTGSAAMLGTPVYMSPEQAQAGAVDHRSDQYAVGVILYECATGRLPFQAPELYPLLHAIVQGVHIPPRALRPDLPAEFEAVIERAMSRDADARFPSMHALGRALLPFASRTGRGLWRDVFGAEPTPLAATTPLAALPAARAPMTTLLPRVRQVCVVTTAFVKRPRVASVAVGVIAFALVVTAAVLPSRGPRLAPVVLAQPAPAPAPVTAPASAPVTAPAPIAAPAPDPPAPQAVPTPVRPRVAAPTARRAQVDGGAPFRLCGGVPCP